MKLKNILLSVRRNRRRMAIPLLVCVLALLAAACTDETDDDTDRLPPGAYPMTFTAAVDGSEVTRGTEFDEFFELDDIAIQIGGEVKRYHVYQDGSIHTINNAPPFYWTNRGMQVTAWCFSTYSATRPTTFTVREDQIHHLGGYPHSDFLYARQEITYSSGGQCMLTFKHLTAKVIVGLTTGDGLTDDDVANATVSFVNQPITSGTIAEEGTVAQSAPGSATIAPFQYDATPQGYAKQVGALLVPQQMQGKKFIKVTIGADDAARDYYYTPTNSTDASLEAGHRYFYAITVKKTGLDVTMTDNGTTWGSDGSAEDVTDKTPPAGYTPADLKIGDYYYSDGTTSDGGYRKYPDGTTAIMPVQPALTGADGKERTVIGIVFKAGRDDSDSGTYTDIAGHEMSTIHGYVVALQDAADRKLAWANKDGQYDFVVGTSTSDSDWQGYDNCQKMKSGGDWSIGHFPAANACIGFGSAEPYLRYAAPAGSSGWFLPSCGQLHFLYKNRDVLSGQINKLKAMNGYESIGWFSEEYYYWSSSEHPDYSDCVRNAIFYDGPTDIISGKTGGSYVRGVFAF